MLPTKEFQMVLALLLKTTNSRGARFADQTILFEFINDGTARLVSTDNTRMTIVELSYAHGQPVGSSFCLYSEYAEKLLKIPNSPRISIAVMGKSILFYNETTAETFDNIESQFRDYKLVVKARNLCVERPAVLRYKLLTDTLRDLKPFVKEAVSLQFQINKPCFIRPILAEFECIESVEVIIQAMQWED